MVFHHQHCYIYIYIYIYKYIYIYTYLYKYYVSNLSISNCECDEVHKIYKSVDNFTWTNEIFDNLSTICEDYPSDDASYIILTHRTFKIICFLFFLLLLLPVIFLIV